MSDTEIQEDEQQNDKDEIARLNEKLSAAEKNQAILTQLVCAGAIDIETAGLLVKARLENTDKDIAEVIGELKKHKPFLFAEEQNVAIPVSTATVRQKNVSRNAVLQKAASKAAASGNRLDVQEYLRIRRRFI